MVPPLVSAVLLPSSAELMEVLGAVVSTVHVKEAGDGASIISTYFAKEASIILNK